MSDKDKILLVEELVISIIRTPSRVTKRQNQAVKLLLAELLGRSPTEDEIQNVVRAS